MAAQGLDPSPVSSLPPLLATCLARPGPMSRKSHHDPMQLYQLQPSSAQFRYWRGPGYLGQPFVVEGDAYGEAVVQKDQAQRQHCLPHKGHIEGPPPHLWANRDRSLS